KFDDVMNDQRKVIYEQRIDLMRTNDVSEDVAGMRHQVIDDMVARFIPEKSYPEQWETDALHAEARRVLGLDLPIADWAKEEGIADEEIRNRIIEASDRKMAEKAARYGPELMRMAEKSLLLQILDQHWKDHLLSLDHLRQGIGLRAYGQRDPLNEYKREAFDLFENMLVTLRGSVTAVLSHVELRLAEPERELQPRGQRKMRENRAGPTNGEDKAPPPRRIAATGRISTPALDPDDTTTWGKVGRNAPCPCGSSKKYKHCHGRVA
ncbi:MAG: SEC-C metal-binding domain-containing protein, partial [Alphaproteobacteria bacterium]